MSTYVNFVVFYSKWCFIIISSIVASRTLSTFILSTFIADLRSLLVLLTTWFPAHYAQQRQLLIVLCFIVYFEDQAPLSLIILSYIIVHRPGHPSHACHASMLIVYSFLSPLRKLANNNDSLTLYISGSHASEFDSILHWSSSIC